MVTQHRNFSTGMCGQLGLTEVALDRAHAGCASLLSSSNDNMIDRAITAFNLPYRYE